jgi:gliding motility-associated-like protein
MTKKVLLLLTAVSGLFIGKTSAQLTIVNNSNATQLAQLLAGSGVTISNAVKNCPNTALGTFANGNATNLGLSSGIVLTTGTVAPVAGSASNFASTDNSNGTDANLNAISNATTQDVCVLEFDIVPQGNVLNFRYVFGSEEYPEYVCSPFNDVFGFFVSGPNPGGGNYNSANIALIPNSSLSVAINTVNPGTPGGGYSASGCQSLAYSQYYTDNTGGTTIVYDGFTTVLNATISVVPCQQYHIKLAIGDAGDGIYDSGVFIEANSFVSQSTSITAAVNGGFSSMFEGCVGGVFTITVPNLATSSTAINYTVSGTATNGVDYTTLTGTTYVNPGTSTALVYVDPLQDGLPEGAETVTITINDPCTGLPVASATLNINDAPVDTAYASSNFVCQSGQVQLTATGGGTYSWSPPTGLSSTTIANPTATITSDITYTVNITFGNCVQDKSVTIDVDSITTSIISFEGSQICPGTTDTLVATSDGGVGNITYQWSPVNQVSDPTSQYVFTTPANTTTYNVTVTDSLGCSATANFTLNVATNLQVSLGPDVNVCPEDVPYVLGLPGGPYTSYSWSNGATTPTISITSSGDYSVTAIGGQCTYTSDTITVTLLTPVNPTLADSFFCSGTEATLSAEGNLTNVLWNTGATTGTITVTTPGDYYYTANDANGCAVASDTATVTEIQSPVVNATASPDTICPGSPSVLSSGAAQGLSYTWSNGANTSTTTVTSGGTYYLTVSDAVCSSFDTVVVTEYVNPQPTVTADTTVCNGQAVTFTLINGPFNTYTWSNGATGVTSITVSAAGQYNVTVNDGNCDWTSNSVSLNNFPTPQPTLTDTGACYGQQIVLSAENGLINIEWSNQESTQTITVTSGGTFYYTAQDVNGCPVASDTVDVTFQTPPSVNATASPDTICDGGSSTLSANATGSNLSYVWFPGGQNTSTITVSQPGIYIVEVNDFFCPSFDTIEVYQYQFPPVSIGNDITVCAGSQVTLAPTGGPYVSYNWSNGATSATVDVSNPGSYSVTVDNGACQLVSNTITLSNYPGSNPALSDTTLCVGNTVMLTVPAGYFDILWSTGETTDTIYVTTSGNYSFTGATPNECPAASDTATVTFVNPPAVNATASPDSICAGGESTLTANAIGGNLTYQWSTQANTASITVSQTGTYYLTVSDGSCANYDTVTVSQYTHAPVVLNNDTVVCPGKSVTVVPSGAPYVTYNWSNGLSTPSITVSTPGNYTVTVNDGHCDYVSDVFTLSNFQPVTPFAYSDTNVCAGQPVTLSGDPDFQNIVWSNQQSGVSITVTTAGTYSYTATDGSGCQVTSTSVTVTHRPYPNPNIVATPPAICVGQGSTTLNAGSETGVTYVWQPTGAGTPTIQVTQPGTYIVQANNNGCIKLDTITVNAADTPALNLQPLVLSCCQTVVINPAPGQGYTYVWNTGSSDSTLTVTTTNNAIVNYTVTATNSAGCTSVGATSVIIKCINAVASALPDTIMFGDSAQLNVLTDYQATFSYSWSPSASLTGATTQNPVAAPLEETAYTVTVTDVEDGCVDTATVTVYVLYGDKIAMPNAFTPNGDGKNDDFYPVLLGPYQKVIEFRIYNRWGAMVHNSTDPWNGEFSGKEQPAGTYVYYIIIRVPDPKNQGETKDIKLSGSFTLLR